MEAAAEGDDEMLTGEHASNVQRECKQYFWDHAAPAPSSRQDEAFQEAEIAANNLKTVGMNSNHTVTCGR
ncbi:hypothetical protein AXF42_Ash006821 [Apostasia shenzhenica]|uniref:Uncharacterized protein n=1 Tax=Apostasia shenzhenica TaxID=1088818 RepID=A0A2I0AJ93_9ASPA|nr:hypothetical protein AXF42_Ash006821 [Apostasia shenzhenica]